MITARVNTLSESGKENACRDVCRQGWKELFSGFYQGNHIKVRNTFNQLGRIGYYPISPLFHLVTIKGKLRRSKLALERHNGRDIEVTVHRISFDIIISSVTWSCSSLIPMRLKQRSLHEAIRRITCPPSLYLQMVRWGSQSSHVT